MPSCDERLSPEADAAARYARTVALIEEIAERERMSPARVRARAYTDELIARRRAALGAGEAVGAGLRVGARTPRPGARHGGAAVLDGLRNGGFRVSALLGEDDAAGRVRLAAPSPAEFDAPALRVLLQKHLAAAAALSEAEAAEIDALVRKVIADHRAELDALERARGRDLTLDDLPPNILRALIEALGGIGEIAAEEVAALPRIDLPAALLPSALDVVSFERIGWPPPFEGTIDAPKPLNPDPTRDAIYKAPLPLELLPPQPFLIPDPNHGRNRYEPVAGGTGTRYGTVRLWIWSSATSSSGAAGEQIRWPPQLFLMARVDDCDSVAWVQYKCAKVIYRPQIPSAEIPKVEPSEGILAPSPDTEGTMNVRGNATDISADADDARERRNAFSQGEQPPSSGEDASTPSDSTVTDMGPSLTYNAQRSLPARGRDGGAVMLDAPGPGGSAGKPEKYSNQDVPPDKTAIPDENHAFTNDLFLTLLGEGGLATATAASNIGSVNEVDFYQVFRAYLFCLQPRRTVLGYVAWGVLHRFRRVAGKAPSVTSSFHPSPRWIRAKSK